MPWLMSGTEQIGGRSWVVKRGSRVSIVEEETRIYEGLEALCTWGQSRFHGVRVVMSMIPILRQPWVTVGSGTSDVVASIPASWLLATKTLKAGKEPIKSDCVE